MGECRRLHNEELSDLNVNVILLLVWKRKSLHHKISNVSM